MSERRRTANITARIIRSQAERNNVSYRMTGMDSLAHHITRLAGDDVHFDQIEEMLIGLQRAGRIDRTLMVRLQARYLRESGL